MPSGPTASAIAARARPEDHYGALVRSIVGQQLSTTAARAIFGRLVDRFGGRTPTPAEVLADDPEELRRGRRPLPRQGQRSCARWPSTCSTARLTWSGLDALPDDEVIAELVAVKGIGPWSAHMFLMFHLGRPDVLAVGDLGIRRAMMVHYGLPALPGARRDGADRRAVAPVPDAGLPVSVALAGRGPTSRRSAGRRRPLEPSAAAAGRQGDKPATTADGWAKSRRQRDKVDRRALASAEFALVTVRSARDRSATPAAPRQPRPRRPRPALRPL